MSYSGFVWECECGNVEYGEHPPKECKKCYRVESFTKLPEEIADEKEKDLWEESIK